MYYNILTGQKSELLPACAKLPDGSVQYTQDIKAHLASGWREMPKSEPVASAESVIMAISYVQDKVDPLKVMAVVSEKPIAKIQAEQAAAAKAASDAEATRVAEREAWISDIVKAFPDEKQAEAIRLLAERVRPW